MCAVSNIGEPLVVLGLRLRYELGLVLGLEFGLEHPFWRTGTGRMPVRVACTVYTAECIKRNEM